MAEPIIPLRNPGILLLSRHTFVTVLSFEGHVFTPHTCVKCVSVPPGTSDGGMAGGGGGRTYKRVRAFPGSLAHKLGGGRDAATA